MMKIGRIEKLIYSLIPNFLLRRILPKTRKFDFFNKTKNTQTCIPFEIWYNQKIKGHCRNVYWPVHTSSLVSNYNRIRIGVDTSPGLMPGCYIHGINGIIIGDYTQISANVGIQSANHKLTDLRIQTKCRPIIIGSYCWLGMNVMVLPEVELGDFTIVGAGSVVTKSFPEGYCVIAGNPAKKIRDLNPNECVMYKNSEEYIGYLTKDEFQNYDKEFININI